MNNKCPSREERRVVYNSIIIEMNTKEITSILIGAYRGSHTHNRRRKEKHAARFWHNNTRADNDNQNTNNIYYRNTIQQQESHSTHSASTKLPNKSINACASCQQQHCLLPRMMMNNKEFNSNKTICAV